MQAYNAPGTRNAMLQSNLHDVDFNSLIIKWTVIKLAGFATSFLILSIIRLILKIQGIKYLKARQLILTAVVVGIINGLIQNLLIPELDVFETGTYFARICAPITLATLMLFTLSALSSNVRKYRSEAAKAQRDLDSLRVTQNLQQEILEGYQDLSSALSAKIFARSNEAMHRLTELNIRKDLLDPNIADEIRLISDSTIRELSHEIASNYQGMEAKSGKRLMQDRSLNLFHIFRDSVKFAPLNPFAFTSAFMFLLFGAMIRHATWDQAIFMGAACFFVLYAVQLFGIYIYRIFGWQNIYTVLIVVLLSGSIPITLLDLNLFQFRSLIPNWDNYPPSRALFMGGIVAVTFVGYIQQAGLLHSEDILKSRRQNIVNTQLAVKPINKEIVQISRNWARHLHGRVQAQILAATFTLEKAQEASDLEGVKAAFNEIVNVLLHADKIEMLATQSLKQALLHRTEQWSGLIEIALHVSPELASRSGMEINVIADIVEEMISNASRHGAASTIRIELARRNPTQLSIKSIDNGSHFDIKSKGFGSRFFDEVSQGRWDISRNSAFAETTVSVLFELENIYVFPHPPLAPEADI